MSDQSSQLSDYYQAQIDRWSDERYALDKRFVSLTLLIDQGEQAQGQRWQEQRTFEQLAEILEATPEQAVVLLGPPGSGKSTLLRHFELDNAKAVLDQSDQSQPDAPLTLFASLNDFRGNSLPDPLTWLNERWAKIADKYSALPDLTTVLRERRITLLLDALNEIPATQTEAIGIWRDFLRELTQDYPGNRVIFSCRSLDYSSSLSSGDHPVPQIRIESLSNDQVQEFLQAYCPDYADKLWQNLEGTRQLELLRSPFYLLLLIQQTQDGEVPEGRAALFSGFVRQALRREINRPNPHFQADGGLISDREVQRFNAPRDWRTPFDLPERSLLIPKLSQLAFAMQSRREDSSESGQVRVDYDTALNLLKENKAEDILQAGEDLLVLEQDLGRDEVVFRHQLLQEYFAARQLVKEPNPSLVRQTWRADQVSPSLQETLDTLPDSDPLPALPGTGWEETTLLAAAMSEQPEQFIDALMTANLALAGRAAAQPEVNLSEKFKESLRWSLVGRCGDADTDLRARIAAGLALGELGDPRFKRDRGPDGDYLLPLMIEIPDGVYTIGSEDGDDDEKPVHRVELAPFQIAQFPVTNAEWKLFMEAGGYDDERWWVTEEDKAWQSGKSTAEGAKQWIRGARQFAQKNYDSLAEYRLTSKQIEDRRYIADMTNEQFESHLDIMYPKGRKTQPRFWNNDAFNNPAQPVVGICWYEARAYCRWLNTQTKQARYRLPTAVQREAAARGLTMRRYAYGNEFDFNLCNTFETHIRRTTPIGVFPGGETPEGLVDMSSNLLEWTSSVCRNYPHRIDDGWEDSIKLENALHILCGGSWAFDPRIAYAGYRSFLNAGYRNAPVGFRLSVCVPP